MIHEWNEAVWWTRGHRLRILSWIWLLAWFVGRVAVVLTFIEGTVGEFVTALAAAWMLRWTIRNDLWVPPSVRRLIESEGRTG